jgi:serine/threonine protein kinase
MNEPSPTASGPATVVIERKDAPLPAVPGYDLLKLLGRGGMGKVFKARDTKLNRIVALKMITQEADERMQARFAEEVQAVAGLRHANIAQIYESGQVEGKPFYTMEYLPGGSLNDALKAGPLPPPIAARTVAKIARAIHHAHQHGIVHRDLKPGNILLEAYDQPDHQGETATSSSATLTLPASFDPKVTDFGLAKRLQEDIKLTRTGDIVGTPGYMAPEQASGVMSKVGPATDTYALGAILYECLTGRPPFAGPDAVQTVMMVLSMDPVPPRVLQPKLPVDLDTICLKCLEKPARKRYASAAALADDLEAFLDDRPIAARPTTSWERTAKWARRNPWKALAACLLVVLLIGASISALLLKRINTRLAAQKREADQVVALTLQELDQLTFDLSDQLYEMPQGEKLLRDVLERARVALLKLDAIRPNDASVRTHQLYGYDKLANAEARLGRLDAALGAQQRAYELAAELTQQAPHDLDLRRKRVVMAARLANLHTRLDHQEAALPLMREMETGIAALLRDDPDNLDNLELNSVALVNRYGRQLLAGQANQAEATLRELLSGRERLAELDPANDRRKLDVADALGMLASFLGNAARAEEALNLLARQEAVMSQLPGPPTVRVKQIRAGLHWSRGDIYAGQLKPDQAQRAYLLALQEFASLADSYPSVRDYRVSMAQMLWSIGNAWSKVHQVAKARPHLLEAQAILDQLARDHQEDELSRKLAGWVKELLAIAGQEKSQ